jgi:hypothetical protein
MQHHQCVAAGGVKKTLMGRTGERRKSLSLLSLIKSKVSITGLRQKLRQKWLQAQTEKDF